jgi:DNA gyrase subunit A
LKVKALIAEQLKEIKKKYAKPRKTQLISPDDLITVSQEDMVENYNVRLVLTHDGYFKKITLASLRGNDEQNLKEGDYILSEEETDNLGELVVFTNHARVFKIKVADLDTTKASALGEFLPAKFNMNEGERPILAKALTGYNKKHNLVLLFENGKGVRVSMENYNADRRRLTSAFSKASPVVAAFYEDAPKDILMVDNMHRAILLSSSMIPLMATKTAGGLTLFTMKKGKQKLVYATTDFAGKYETPDRYRKKKIPATGILLAEKDIQLQQIKFE